MLLSDSEKSFYLQHFPIAMQMDSLRIICF